MVQEIKLEKLKIHPNNVRKEYEGIEELAQSIRENGIMQNLTVVPDPEEAGSYLVVIGNRRLTAAREAGIETAPCVVIDEMSDKDQVLTMLTENMNRKDLKVYEEAAAIQMCLTDFGFDMKELEDKTGMSRATLYHRKNVAELDAELVKDRMNDDKFQLTLKDFAELEKIKDVEKRSEIFKESISKQDMLWKIQRAVEAQETERIGKELFKICESEGIEPAPEDADIYSKEWYNITNIYLDSQAERKLKKELESKNNDEEWFFKRSYGYLYIIKHVDQEEVEEKSSWQIEQEERRKREKKFEIIEEATKAEIRNYVMKILTGEAQLADQTKEVEVLERLWDLFLIDRTIIEESALISAIMNEDMKWPTEEEKSSDQYIEAVCLVSDLPMTKQQIAVAYWQSVEDNDSLMTYNGKYATRIGEPFKIFCEILGMYGFDFSDKEYLELIEGTHEIYVPEEKEDENS